MKRNQYNDLDAGLIYFLALITPLVIGLIFSLIFNLIANRYGFINFSASPILTSLYLGIVSLSFLGLFFVYNKVGKVSYKQASLFKLRFGLKNLILCTLIAFVTLFGFNYLINYLFYVLEKIGYSPDASLPLPLNNGWWLTINLFVLAVIPAFCEEIIYRGIILNGFRRFGKINAILVSALFFALAHGSAMQFIYQFILGIILGFVLVKTGSIIASIFVHFLNNSIVVVYNYIMPAQSSNFGTTSIVASFALAIAATALLILLIYNLKEKKSVQISYNEEYNRLYPQKDRNFSSPQSKTIFWISIVISVILWTVGTFFS